jgi:CheY-like chemotaxis protein
MQDTFKILYAEDEADLRDITEELLVSEGYHCTAVADGLEAMNRLQEQNFDLLITDFQMPNMDGALLLLLCRQIGRHMPVIFISGNRERLPIEELALQDCCASLLHKPLAFDDLLRAIEKARYRNHEYDCHGRAFNPRVDGHTGIFPGQHYIS